MSDDKQMDIGLGVDLDKASIEAAKNSMTALEKSIENFQKSTAKGSTADPFAGVEQSAKQAKQSVDKLNDSIKKTGDAKADGPDFGRGESAIRTTGGAIGALGGEAGAAVEGGLSAFAEIPAVFEQISLVGAPAIAAIAGLAVIMAGLAIASKLLSDRQKEARERAEEFVSSLDAFYDATGKTTEELKALQEERQKESEILQTKIDILRERIQAEKDEQSALEGFGERLGGMFDSGEVDGYQDAIKEYEKQLGESNTEQEAYNRVMEENANAAADAAAALDELNASLLENAATEADLFRAELDAQERNKQANADRLNEIEKERKIREKELQSIKQSGASGEEAEKRIAELNAELSNLGKEAGIVKDVMKSQKDETKEAGNAMKRSGESSAKMFAEIAERNREFNRRKKEETKKAIDDEVKQQQDFQKKIADINFKAQVDMQKIAIDGNRKQQDLLRDAIRSQRDLLFEQDFLGLFKSQEDLANKFSDAAVATQRQIADSLLSQSNATIQAQSQAGGGSITNNIQNSASNTISIPVNGAQDPALVAQIVQQEVAALL